jgi:hypothetical protein
MIASVAPAISASVAIPSVAVGTCFKICRETVLEHDTDDDNQDAKARDGEKHGNLFVRHGVASSISTVGAAIGMAVVPASCISTRITRCGGAMIPLRLRSLEEKIAYDGRDDGHQDQPGDKIVHALKPLFGGRARMARR